MQLTLSCQTFWREGFLHSKSNNAEFMIYDNAIDFVDKVI